MHVVEQMWVSNLCDFKAACVNERQWARDSVHTDVWLTFIVRDSTRLMPCTPICQSVTCTCVSVYACARIGVHMRACVCVCDCYCQQVSFCFVYSWDSECTYFLLRWTVFTNSFCINLFVVHTVRPWVCLNAWVKTFADTCTCVGVENVVIFTTLWPREFERFSTKDRDTAMMYGVHCKWL